MTSTLAGSRIAIIGGSAGLGFAIARLALEEGACPIIGSHNSERLATAAARLGPHCESAVIDVTDAQSVMRFFADNGPADHLVYTAGDWARRSATPGRKFNLDDAHAAFEVRFFSLLRVIDAALPHLAPEGSIVLTGGLLAHRPMPGQAISSAVTGAVEHLAKALAVDLAPRRVNVVVPGFIATEVWAQLSVEAVEQMVSKQAVKRAGKPEEVAEAYLAFMRSTYTTGQALVVDGGMALT